jgi:hypothetical protein
MSVISEMLHKHKETPPPLTPAMHSLASYKPFKRHNMTH